MCLCNCFFTLVASFFGQAGSAGFVSHDAGALTDSTFSKLYDKESKFEEDEKYNLSPEQFRAWLKLIVEKVTKINVTKEFKVAINA